jgi:hypothetical protein
MNAKKKKEEEEKELFPAKHHACPEGNFSCHSSNNGHVCMKPVIIFLRWNDASRYLVFETVEVIPMGK